MPNDQSNSGGGDRTAPNVVDLWPWKGDPAGPAMDVHVAAVAKPKARTLAEQRDALSWAVRCCERIARDAANEAEAQLTSDQSFAAASLMADRVRGLRYLLETLMIASQSEEDRARLLERAQHHDELRELMRK